MEQPWVKLYRELLGEKKMPKNRFIEAERWIWVGILLLAGGSPVRGKLLMAAGVPYTLDDLADALLLRPQTKRLLPETLRKFKDLGMLRDGEGGVIEVTNWEKRQRQNPSDAPEAVRERVRKHRQGKQPETPSSVTRCNGKVTSGNEAGNEDVTRQSIEVEGEGDKEKDLKEGGPPAKKPQPPCSFCNPLPPKHTPIQALVKFCHDLYKKKRGMHPTFAEGQWIGILSKLSKQHGDKTVRTVYAHYLDSQDAFASKQGYSITEFRRSFDGVRDAYQNGRPYGSTRRGTQKTSRSHLPSKEGTFGPAGSTQL